MKISLKATIFVVSAAGTAIMWLSTNSIANTITIADGNIHANLRWIGWGDPPRTIASAATDNIWFFIGLALLLVGVLFLIFCAIEKITSKQEEGTEMAGDDNRKGIFNQGPNFGSQTYNEAPQRLHLTEDLKKQVLSALQQHGRTSTKVLSIGTSRSINAGDELAFFLADCSIVITERSHMGMKVPPQEVPLQVVPNEEPATIFIDADMVA